MDATLQANQEHWLVRETIGLLRRTLQPPGRVLAQPVRADRAGLVLRRHLLELALACDRSYQLALPDDADRAPQHHRRRANFGLYPMVTDQSRLERRFYDEAAGARSRARQGGPDARRRRRTRARPGHRAPDDIDWADETRIAIEERVAMSPDALTGMEANLRFNGPENMFTRVFRRLTAWQNWIFQRPNAVGEKGASRCMARATSHRLTGIVSKESP